MYDKICKLAGKSKNVNEWEFNQANDIGTLTFQPPPFGNVQDLTESLRSRGVKITKPSSSNAASINSE